MERLRRAARSSLVIVLMATGLRFAWAGTNAVAGQTVTLNPEADATVSASQPDTNFGRGGGLRVNGEPPWESYLRFRVPAGPIRRAVLRLWVVDPTNDGPRIRRSVGPLNEATATWGTRATVIGTPVDSGALKAGSWAEWDVSSLVAGPGEVTLAALADSSDGVEFGSRESDHSPQLVIALASAAPTSPTTSVPPPTTATSSPRPVLGRGPECPPNWAPAEPIAHLADGLGEMSAFIATPNHHGWGWGIRDSGKPASLYAIKPASDGVRTQEFRAYELRNSDWEDMAYTPGPVPGTGHLWVLENVGNGWTGDRWIYQFEEPDPENPPPLPAPPPPPPAPTSTTAASTTTTTAVGSTATTTTTTAGFISSAAIASTAPAAAPPPAPPATLVGSYRWAYPDVQANTETMFVFDGDLVVVSKTDPSRVYRFNGPLQPWVVNVPTYVGTLPSGHFLSVAAISADQRTLAVANHGKVDVYVNRGDVNDLTALIAHPVVRHDMPPDNREGGSFFPYGSCDLLLVAESRTIWRLEHG